MDMLSYSREEMEPVHVACDVNEVAKEAADLARGRADEEGVAFSLKLGGGVPAAHVDPKGIHRCLLNLLSNAFDAVDHVEKGSIELATHYSARDRTLQIRVTDNGCGIPAHLQERVFDVFCSTKGSQGTGLGLAVVKKIIDEHEGQVQVASVGDSGTTFTIVLPLTAS